VRSLDPEAWLPPLSRLCALARGPRRVLVKAAPSLDADAVAGEFDVAYVSHGGECVEAFLESRTDRGTPQRVRAVVLPDDGPSAELTGDRGDAPAGPVGEALFVPDPAVIRARLLRELCVRHGLTLVDDGIAWLTGPACDASPWLRTFRVVATADVGGVPDVLRRAGARSIRVHVRGTPAAAGDLEALWRKSTSPSGAGGTLDVFVSRFLGRPGAAIARA
jgi:hypothetical protein